MKEENKKLVGYGSYLSIISVLFIILFSINAGTAAKEKAAINISAAATEANNSLVESNSSILEMKEAGFNVMRVVDLITEAEQLFQAQFALEEKGGRAYYDEVLRLTKEIADIKDKAFQANDELKILEDVLKRKSREINLSDISLIYEKAKQEFNDERYEKVIELVDEAYAKIGETEAAITRMRLMYLAATKTIAEFFKKNWKIITAVITILLIAYWIARRQIKILLLNSQIRKLELEKSIINDLIGKAQKDYFDSRKLSEVNYHIKIKKFAELIRDIDRQTPLIKEEIVRARGGIRAIESKDMGKRVEKITKDIKKKIRREKRK